MEKDWETGGQKTGIGKRIIRAKNYLIEKEDIYSKIEKVQLFNEKIQYLESYIESLINDHEDVKESIRQWLLDYYNPDILTTFLDKNIKLDDKLQLLSERESKIDTLIEKAGGLYKDYKSKRTELKGKVQLDKISIYNKIQRKMISLSGIELIDDLLDKIEELKRYKKELEKIDFIFTYNLPEEMLLKFKILEKKKLITRKENKPNFKHLRHAIAFFDHCHIEYDIPNYGKLKKRDGIKNKIIAESIFVNGKRPAENTISRTRNEMGLHNKYLQDILEIFPDLSL
jgi:hypothetical protein